MTVTLAEVLRHELITKYPLWLGIWVICTGYATLVNQTIYGAVIVALLGLAEVGGLLLLTTVLSYREIESRIMAEHVAMAMINGGKRS